MVGVAFAKVGAVEEYDIENVGEVIGVFVGIGQAIDEEVALLRVLIREEGVEFGHARDTAEEVEVDAADEGRVVRGRRGGDLFLLPFL